MIPAAILIFVAVVFPYCWVRFIFWRHGRDRPDLQGTGGELARHLIDHLGIPGAKVEATDQPDQYDPSDRTVRLNRKHFDGRSLAAVAVAAHEVGHAIQHSKGERALAWRQQLAAVASLTDKLAGLFFIAAPIITVVARSPAVLFALIAIGVLLLSVRVLMDLVTLPVEFDASFGKALPLLEHGGYLPASDLPAVRSVLRAAALTYLAGALITLVNLARWVRLVR